MTVGGPENGEVPKPSDLNSLGSDLAPASGEAGDHERIWLEPRTDDDTYAGDHGRMWCQHKVWDDGVEYVRATENAAPRAALAATAVVQQQMCDRMKELLTLVETMQEALMSWKWLDEYEGPLSPITPSIRSDAVSTRTQALAAYDRFKGGP